MATIICTLYENHYYYGVGALVNSLSKTGFVGNIFIGYRGNLPSYHKREYQSTTDFYWKEGIVLLKLEGGINLYFLKLNVTRHLAHYKPHFMLRLFNDVAPDADNIFYIDPDIIIKCKWDFFEKWVSYGVTVVHEIVSIDMPPNHPTRKQWEIVIRECNQHVVRSLYAYLNCGFCGVNRKTIQFIELWDFYISQATTVYGQDEEVFSTFDRTGAFWSIDQDTFNMVAMSCDCEISEMGPEAMDFSPGGWTMSHATGSPKPWNKNYILASLHGRKPTMADKQYWLNCNQPLQLFPNYKIRMQLTLIRIASFVARFYKR